MKEDKLPTLAEHDHEALSRHLDSQRDERPNGIACDKCGHDLLDIELSRGVLCTYPPRKKVRCPGCGFRGSRIA